MPVLNTERRKKPSVAITPTETIKLFENWKEKNGVEAKKSGKRKTRAIRTIIEIFSKERKDFFCCTASKDVLGSSIEN